MVRPFDEKNVVNNPSMHDEGGRRKDDQVPPQTRVLPEETVTNDDSGDSTLDIVIPTYIKGKRYRKTIHHSFSGVDVFDDSICQMKDSVNEVVQMNDQGLMVYGSRKSKIVTTDPVIFGRLLSFHKRLSVAEVCAYFSLQDVKVDSLIIQGNKYNYKLYFKHVMPVLQEANPKTSYSTLSRLLGAKWREVLARRRNQCRSRREKRAGVLPRNSKKETECKQQKQEIISLKQEVSNLKKALESLSKSGSSYAGASSSDATASAVCLPENSSHTFGSAVASPSESLKERPNTMNDPEDPLEIKSEIDDDVQFVCEISFT